MTKQEVYERYMKDGTEYCCYCGTARYKLGCCGEVHFEMFNEMDKDRQEEFLSWEEYTE